MAGLGSAGRAGGQRPVMSIVWEGIAVTIGAHAHAHGKAPPITRLTNLPGLDNMRDFRDVHSDLAVRRGRCCLEARGA